MDALPASSLGSGTMGSQPPALPPRPSQQAPLSTGYGGLGGYNSYGGVGSYGGVSSMYSPLGGSMGGSMYGGMYGNNMLHGGYGMNRFSQSQSPNNSFTQLAEENSRQAFQSIESIVQAVGSVAMMMESTFQAVYNSFRAVLGVADHFSRMKTHFAQIFSALAVIRSLKWLYRKLLVLLRLREAGVSEEVWASAAEATLSAAAKSSADGGHRSSWPIMMFFAVVVGGPWLIWKFLSSLTQNQGGEKWASGEDSHFVAQALHDFSSHQQGEISFRQGQRINIAPKEFQPRVRGWLLASVDGQKTGLVPANYLKILGKRPGRCSTLPGGPSELLPNNGATTAGTPAAVGASAAGVPAVGATAADHSCCSSGTQPHGSHGNPSHAPGSHGNLNDGPSGLPFEGFSDLETGLESRQDFGLNTMTRVPVTEQDATDILEDSTNNNPTENQG